ncbi:hypothetical protein [Streptomyces sp. NBC_01431]|uniref:hypothetical protein n=1 Tax=Streptomyces sp. NBC_01431 TaxID=2903863 RepID=UPI002E330DF0|nr:hypothetical protein [Streptomyces sp. NBC_01431]
MTLKEKNSEKARPLLSHQEVGWAGLTHCSDLLEDFFATISRMEREYLQAAAEGWSVQGAHTR